MNEFVIIATVLCCLGLLALRVSWRSNKQLLRCAKPLGWILLAAASYCSAQAWGLEFGISYMLAEFSLVALVLVALNAEIRPQATGKTKPDITATTVSSQPWLTLLAAGPFAAIASCFATLGIAGVLPVSDISGMAVAAILFPTLWGVIAYAVCFINRPVPLMGVFSVVATAFGVALFW